MENFGILTDPTSHKERYCTWLFVLQGIYHSLMFPLSGIAVTLAYHEEDTKFVHHSTSF